MSRGGGGSRGVPLFRYRPFSSPRDRLGHFASSGLRWNWSGGHPGFDPGNRRLLWFCLFGHFGNDLGRPHRWSAGGGSMGLRTGHRGAGLGELGLGVMPAALGTTLFNVIIHVFTGRAEQASEDDALPSKGQISIMIETPVPVGVEPHPLIGVEPQTSVRNKVEFSIGIEIQDLYQTYSPYLAIGYGLM